MLDRLNTFKDSVDDPLKTSKGFPLLFAMYFTYMYNYNDKEFESLYKYLNTKKASEIVGPGADYSASKIKIYMNHIQHWIAMKKAA